MARGVAELCGLGCEVAAWDGVTAGGTSDVTTSPARCMDGRRPFIAIVFAFGEVTEVDAGGGANRDERDNASSARAETTAATRNVTAKKRPKSFAVLGATAGASLGGTSTGLSRIAEGLSVAMNTGCPSALEACRGERTGPRFRAEGLGLLRSGRVGKVFGRWRAARFSDLRCALLIGIGGGFGRASSAEGLALLRSGSVGAVFGRFADARFSELGSLLLIAGAFGRAS